MCTCIKYVGKDIYFGRNLDYEKSFGENIVFLPRHYPLSFYCGEKTTDHYAILGMAHVAFSFPLFYDGINEKGLGIAGLNFVGNTYYQEEKADKKNVPQYEFMLYLLATCRNVEEVKGKLKDINLIGKSFHDAYPASELHYMVADKENCIVIETTKDGLQFYENPTNALTNNPPFPMQLFSLNNYQKLSISDPVNHFSNSLPLKNYSRGMGGLGLPGDLSSSSRFVKVVFTLLHATKEKDEISSVLQFYHILESVLQQKGLCEVKENEFEYTIYSSCCNLEKGIYYYKTYYNDEINAVDMNLEEKEGEELKIYPLLEKKMFKPQNQK